MDGAAQEHQFGAGRMVPGAEKCLRQVLRERAERGAACRGTEGRVDRQAGVPSSGRQGGQMRGEGRSVSQAPSERIAA